MKTKIGMLMLIAAFSMNTYADDSAAVDEGVQQYDWQSCVHAKSDECINACATSEDTRCQDKCTDMAKDKCESKGVNPPQ